MPNPFHAPHLAPIVRAVASKRAQVRPALISADNLQLIREYFARHSERLETMVDTQSSQLRQAKTNCQSALAYIDAISFDPTTIDKGIVTTLLGWTQDIANTNELDSESGCSGPTEKVHEILQALQTRIRGASERT
jgi:hypothetical protein